jgi:hypothetical protein
VDKNLNWVFSVLLTNAGSGTVQNVKVTSESFSTALGKLQVLAVEPKEVLSIPSGGSAAFNFTCTRQDVGFSTVVVSYTIGISDSAGSTSFSGRTSF